MIITVIFSVTLLKNVFKSYKNKKISNLNIKNTKYILIYNYISKEHNKRYNLLGGETMKCPYCNNEMVLGS